jgi:hypothetical protein
LRTKIMKFLRTCPWGGFRVVEGLGFRVVEGLGFRVGVWCLVPFSNSHPTTLGKILNHLWFKDDTQYI